MEDLKITEKSIAALRPHPNNARRHSKKQIKQIAASIERFGWANPVLIDTQDRIIAGHGRVAAAKQLGLTSVPTIRLEKLSEAEVRAYIIADNRLAELAEWDDEVLAIELQSLVELDFDVEVTGFDTAEIDLRIDALGAPGAADDGDEIPELDAFAPPVTWPGDMWLIGPHRLLCGDATMRGCYERLMGGDRAQMVFSDPPFNVPVDGHVSGLGKVRHREFAMASGEMSEGEFTTFLETVLGHMAESSVDGAIHYLCMDWKHAFELLTAARAVYSEYKNLCVWTKSNAGMGSLYRSQHELVFVFKNGTAPHVNNVELGRHGRYRTNVWPYAGMNAFGAGRADALASHPTVKPVAMVADAIRDCSRRGDVVLDAFAGSGTTLIAAERAGRRGYAMEIDPRYVDVALTRFRNTFDVEPIHETSGLSFDHQRIWREIEGDDAPEPSPLAMEEGNV